MNPVEQKVLQASKYVEEQVDAAIEKLDNLEVNDLAEIIRKRKAALKKQIKQKQQWIDSGHGEYTQLMSERELFDAGKKSERVVLHCFRRTTMRCAVVDKHLGLLAKKHIETKFCSLDVEKAPFICSRLKIRIIPTIVLCKSGQVVDYIVGFDELGGEDDFSTEVLEWRLAKSEMINYDGDLSTPPDGPVSREMRPFIKYVKKNVRSDAKDSDDSGW